jgi:hypothetical protein
MGALRTSTAELDRRGAFKKNPSRARSRATEPSPKGPLGDPPEDFLSKYGDGPKLLKAWYELIAEAKEVLLTSGDRTHFEMTCRLKVRCQRNGAKTGDFAQLNRHLAQLGLTPASRSAVQGVGGRNPDREEEEWKEAEAGGTGISIQ